MEVVELYTKVYNITEVEVHMDVNMGEDGDDDFIFESRVFQISPLFDEVTLEHGMFFKLKMTTAPGLSKLEIEVVEEDMSHLFPKVDFSKFEDSPFFTGGGIKLKYEYVDPNDEHELSVGHTARYSNTGFAGFVSQEDVDKFHLEDSVCFYAEKDDEGKLKIPLVIIRRVY